MERLTVTQTYFVRVDGADTNDGSADTPGRAFKTIQGAIDALYAGVDSGGNDIIIQVGPGFYPDTNVIIRGPHRGGGRLIIQGDVAHPGNVVLDSGWNEESISTIWAVNGAAVYLRGLQVRATSASPRVLATCLRATFKGIIFLIGPMEFGEAAYAHILAGNAQISIFDSYRIVGGARYHLFSSTGSSIATSGDMEKAVTIVGQPHFSHAFACAQTCSVINWRYPFIGTASGPRHLVSDGGVISMKSLGTDTSRAPSAMPGSADGAILSGFYNGMLSAPMVGVAGAPVGLLLGGRAIVDMNQLEDQVIKITSPAPTYLIHSIVFCQATTALDQAQGGLYSHTGKQGAVLLAADQRYDRLTGAGINVPGSALRIPITTDVLLDRHKLHFSLSIPQGTPSQATILVYILPVHDPL